MILVTGGAGYIGSHTCVELLNAGNAVVVLDDLSNSSRESLRRVTTITGISVPLVIADVRDQKIVEEVLVRYGCSGVIHFAGKKAVQESSEQPLEYYAVNVCGTLSVLNALKAHNIKRLIFSSTATVYGVPQSLPLTEDHPCQPEGPYARSKLIVEDILRDTARSDREWGIGILRYFNPIGAHPLGMIGEDPKGVPSNLMPFITQVAIGRRAKLHVCGSDYPTPDGTGVRDYLHVVDLAIAHVKALQRLQSSSCFTVNLGTGAGTSVLKLIETFERVSGKTIPYCVQARRPGDVAAYYADPTRARHLLGWSAELSIETMCEDQWRWQSRNPDGYGGV